MKEGYKQFICENHQEYPVPLIQTMAFRGAENWCPYCGETSGIFAGKEVDSSPELERRAANYKEMSKSFIKANATFSCSRMMYNGKEVTIAELPEEYLDEQKQIIKEWKYGVEAE